MTEFTDQFPGLKPSKSDQTVVSDENLFQKKLISTTRDLVRFVRAKRPGRKPIIEDASAHVVMASALCISANLFFKLSMGSGFMRSGEARIDQAEIERFVEFAEDMVTALANSHNEKAATPKDEASNERHGSLTALPFSPATFSVGEERKVINSDEVFDEKKQLAVEILGKAIFEPDDDGKVAINETLIPPMVEALITLAANLFLARYCGGIMEGDTLITDDAMKRFNALCHGTLLMIASTHNDFVLSGGGAGNASQGNH